MQLNYRAMPGNPCVLNKREQDILRGARDILLLIVTNTRQDREREPLMATLSGLADIIDQFCGPAEEA